MGICEEQGEVREGRNQRAELGWEGYGDPGWSGDFTSWNQSGPHGTLETNRSVSKRNLLLGGTQHFRLLILHFFL